jgi:hypothetical protein
MGFLSWGKKSNNKEQTDYNLHDDLPVAQAVTWTGPSSAMPSSAAPASYPPPSAPIAPVQMEAGTTKMTSASLSKTKFIPTMFLTRFPTQMECCPSCHARARTRVHTFPNWATWALCVIILFIFWPLCWIPLVMTKVKYGDNSDLLPVGSCFHPTAHIFLRLF